MVRGAATRMTRGPAGWQGRPFPTFAMSNYKCDASALHCLARSEVQVIQILFVTSRVCFVLVLVHKQLRCVFSGVINYQCFREVTSTSVCVCVFFPSILDIKFVGRTSRGHTGGRSHRIFNPPSFCGACLDFCREKDSAIPFPRRP